MKKRKNKLDTFSLIEIVRGDPLLKVLIDRNLVTTYLIITAIYLFLVLGLGIGISIYYEKRGLVLLSLLRPFEIIWVSIVYGGVVPATWLSYIWQIKGYIQTLHHLSSEVLIPSDGFEIIEFTRSSFAKINRGFFFLLPFALTILVMVIWLILFPEALPNAFVYGYRLSYLNISPIFFWAVWIPLTFVAAYQIIWLIIRQITIIRTFSKLYELCDISPRIFHPDKCNGFSSFGDYAIRFSLIVVMFGAWMYLVISLPTFFGQPLNLKLDTFFLLFVYIILVPIALIPPVWRTHKEMLNAKNRELNALAVQIQALMRAKNAKEIQASKDILEQLQKRYLILETEMKTWPFQPLSIRGFGVSAIIPLISTIISLIFT